MRYIARGLNALASPGNEAEVEQLLWTLPNGDLFYSPGVAQCRTAFRAGRLTALLYRVA